MQVYIVPIFQSQERNFAYVVVEKGSTTAAVVDPAETEPLLEVCKHLGVIPSTILTTHSVSSCDGVVRNSLTCTPPPPRSTGTTLEGTRSGWRD